MTIETTTSYTYRDTDTGVVYDTWVEMDAAVRAADAAYAAEADARAEHERADAAAARDEMYDHEASDEYDRNLRFEAAEEAALDAAI